MSLFIARSYFQITSLFKNIIDSPTNEIAFEKYKFFLEFMKNQLKFISNDSDGEILLRQDYENKIIFLEQFSEKIPFLKKEPDLLNELKLNDFVQNWKIRENLQIFLREINSFENF
ncbi:Hypothetical protein KVN_LOCUS62 [uncultured virus]|nr:Hypothetical protein KVN_LOCUS62 [uncultured virus]